MELAARKKASLLDAATEFVDNVYTLETLVREKSAKKSRSQAPAAFRFRRKTRRDRHGL